MKDKIISKEYIEKCMEKTGRPFSGLYCVESRTGYKIQFKELAIVYSCTLGSYTGSNDIKVIFDNLLFGMRDMDLPDEMRFYNWFLFRDYSKTWRLWDTVPVKEAPWDE